MGLLSRIKRSMRALFGGIIESTENPELILQQTIRDMRDRVPELNNSVAQVDLQKTGQQLEHATLASAQALKARDNYVLQMQRRTAEAMQLINQSKQARLQEQLAATMESFQIGDDASTFNEMRDKIDRRAAAAEAKLQLGSASVDNQMQDIEREAMDMQLQDKLLAYKQEMGLLPAGTQQALPAQGETSSTEQSEKVVNNSNRIN